MGTTSSDPTGDCEPVRPGEGAEGDLLAKHSGGFHCKTHEKHMNNTSLVASPFPSFVDSECWLFWSSSTFQTLLAWGNPYPPSVHELLVKTLVRSEVRNYNKIPILNPIIRAPTIRFGG